MKIDLEQRAVRLAEYIVENGATVRAAAKKFSVSKSTVHKDLTERLERMNPSLYIEAKAVLQITWAGAKKSRPLNSCLFG